VPAKNLIGQKDYGFIQIMQNFNYERLGMVASCLGMMKVCLEDSIAWAQSAKPLAKNLFRIRSSVIKLQI